MVGIRMPTILQVLVGQLPFAFLPTRYNKKILKVIHATHIRNKLQHKQVAQNKIEFTYEFIGNFNEKK